jgi:hypothetical protein
MPRPDYDPASLFRIRDYLSKWTEIVNIAAFIESNLRMAPTF